MLGGSPNSSGLERHGGDETAALCVRLSDLSRRSGLPVATVHRIVNKLTGWGALERCPDGGYSIGLRLWETAVLAPRSSSLAEAAQPHLVELHNRPRSVRRWPYVTAWRACACPS
ncbi:helix-turn-helix domain-containing protein [Streptomyces sp. NPDC016566]|uniref:helix-turn-helix domain-containing protein n=1 Tax=unclassified Streptomyces TaxID=2593676 RepID=UPI0036E957D7